MKLSIFTRALFLALRIKNKGPVTRPLLPNRVFHSRAPRPPCCRPTRPRSGLSPLSEEHVCSFQQGLLGRAICLHPEWVRSQMCEMLETQVGRYLGQVGPWTHLSGSLLCDLLCHSEEVISKSPRHQGSTLVWSLRAVFALRANKNLSHPDCQKEQSELVKGEQWNVLLLSDVYNLYI